MIWKLKVAVIFSLKFLSPQSWSVHVSKIYIQNHVPEFGGL